MSSLTPSQLICLYGEDEWEQFVLEWMEGFQPRYTHVDRLGGPGDKGRDIVAYTGEPASSCDLDVFQCKHYDHPLRPSDIWLELGKLCVYTWRGDYRLPRRYRILSPQGVGTRLADLLTRPDQVRTGLIENWGQHCLRRISSTQEFPLNNALLTYVQSFDFGKVGYIPVNEILEQHRKTSHWHQRFKRDYPDRPAADAPPSELKQNELVYIEQLFGAYSEHANKRLSSINELKGHEEIQEHFNRSRKDFYMADSLNRFYRDQFAEGAFDDIKEQIFDGVIDTVNQEHANGYRRVLATTSQAVNVQLSSSEYVPYVEPGDRKGICHHLVNDKKIHWVKK